MILYIVLYINTHMHRVQYTHIWSTVHTYTHTYIEYTDIVLHTRLTIWSIIHIHTHTHMEYSTHTCKTHYIKDF